MEMTMFAVYTQTLVRFLLVLSWAASLLRGQEWHMAQWPNRPSTVSGDYE
jgi:hypothetical protein